jgi:hypothetical protein
VGIKVYAHCPTLFAISTITYKVVVSVPTERADTLPLFLLDPYMYSVEKPAKTDNSNQLAGSLVHRTPDQEDMSSNPRRVENWVC